MNGMHQIGVIAMLFFGAAAVAEGTASSKQWWSLAPLEGPAIPLNGKAGANPVDRFVRARLEEHQLKPSPETDRRTLIRRLYFDLIGLPPTPTELHAVLDDNHPGWYERLVETLLASPQYGERWARHWLDVVHYGDTHGYDKDQPRPHAWPYRDYVIRSFNEDKPYSRFIREQIAGDVLFPGDPSAIEALGFISAGPWDLIGHAELPESKTDGKIARHLDRDDMVANTMSTFTSLTVHCAQCHDHKFDPISSEDYYSLQAVFGAVDRTNYEYYSEPALTEKRTALKAAQRELAGQRRDIDSRVTEAAGEQFTILKRSLDRTRKENGPTENLLMLEAELASVFNDHVAPTLREQWHQVTNEISRVDHELSAMPKPKIAFVGAVHHGSGSFRGTGPDGGKPRPIHLLARGDVTKPGKLVEPGALSAINDFPARFALGPEHSEGDRRRALAEWLTHRDHPLTWRSIVHRIWQYHFGRGLVETPNDFGRMGALPSHPELLDWLAVEFRDGGQSFKTLHRLIVTSATYRQVSHVTAGQQPAAEIDRDNRFLWRMNRRKLEAEAIRDSVLFVSGKLSPAMFGPGFHDFVIEKPEHSPHYQYHLHDPNDPRSHRRSIYRFIVRSQQQPFMTTLDCADPSMQVAKRNESLSALQALALLNNGFMLAMSGHFAERLSVEESVARQVSKAFLLALSRPLRRKSIGSLLNSPGSMAWPTPAGLFLI